MEEDTNRGSEWNKWDLHVHTPASFHWSGGKVLSEMDDIEKEEAIRLFIKTVNESDVKVFAVQDYWTFDWIFELRKYLSTHPGELKKTVLPGMELRIECSTNYRLNIHAILSNEVSDQQLKDFRSELKINWVGDEAKNLSDEALMEFAKRLDVSKASHHGFGDPSTLSDSELLKLGSTTAEVTRGSLSKAIKKVPKGMAFIMLPYSTSDGLLKLDWKKHPMDDIYYMQTAHLFETRDQRNVDLFAGNRTAENEECFENFYKTIGEKAKPATSGSDAHQFDNYGKFPSNKATWIKCAATFKGFEQIMYEPIGRVRIQQLEPEEKSSQLIIDYVEFKNNDGQLQKVPFNQNLNSLIGSRAQGKSNLLKNIAYAIDPEQTKIRNIDTSDFLMLDEFKVVWRDGSSNTLDPIEDKDKGILFIPQKFLGELLYGKDPQFDKFLINLFENKEDFKNGLEAYQKYSDQNLLLITSTLRDVMETRKNGIDKTSKLKKLGNKDAFLKETGELDVRIKQLGVEASISEIDLKQYDDFNEAYKKLDKDITVETQDVAALNNLRSFDVITANQIEEYNFSQATFDKIQKQLEQTDKEFKKEFISSEVARINEKISTNRTQLAKIVGNLKPLKDKIKKHESLISLTKRQGEIRSTITLIEETAKEVSDLKTLYGDKKNDLVSKYVNFETGYNNLSLNIPELQFSDVELLVNFDQRSLQRWAEDNINYHNSTDYRRDDDSKYVNAKAFLDNPSTWLHKSDEYSLILGQMVEGILTGKLVLKAGKDIETTIQELLKNRYKIDFLKSVKNKDGVEFKEMSDGEQMLSLLEMIFKFDDYNYPVLLDQPEDDLDSRAISSTVVDFLVEEKQSRQIIIASHNANLVVCGDSENILVSNKTGGSAPNFHYSNGSIEDEYINAEILEVLEGGVEAFEKRRNKIGKK